MVSMPLWLEYGWTVLVLVILEGLLSADNALVLALIVKDLPPRKRLQALTYGLFGAYVFRFAAIFFASILINIWQFQALGAAYLLYVAARHLFKVRQSEERRVRSSPSFWGTVVRVELMDIAFAVDSILAAVALVKSLPPTSLPEVGGLDGGRFGVVILGGFIGVLAMRLVARFFVRLLEKYPRLEVAAYLIVGWIGIKLAIVALGHPALGVLPEALPQTAWYKVVFWSVMLGLFLWGLVGVRAPAGPPSANTSRPRPVVSAAPEARLPRKGG
ncbi:MAG: TerC family protein [Candidatus Kapabacteria bacterium]|nr:TerC family protein [Candidatus Kapabacteria bacterium]MDW8225486.1 TerC family protein [Bacteroidota bacterium]